jgi:hypothetical protein
MMERVRCGVVVCPIWKELGQIVAGDFAILVHYVRTKDTIEAVVAYTRYRGIITEITDKFKTIQLKPDWRDKLQRRVG